MAQENDNKEEDRETVTGAVSDVMTAEAVVARLAALSGRAGEISIVVETIEDDPATPFLECGICLRADVPASQVEAARAALEEPGGEGDGGEGGI